MNNNTNNKVKLIEEYKCDTVEELFDIFAPWNQKIDLSGFIFRGHSQESYKLIPSALREGEKNTFWRKQFIDDIKTTNWESWQIWSEFFILREFYRNADRKGLEVPISDKLRKNLTSVIDVEYLLSNEIKEWLPKDLLEIASLAQHYGIPTRLLDWTYDPYIAFYFAFYGAMNEEGNCVIWVLDKELISALKLKYPSLDLDFITPHYAGNPNLSAQKGVFTHWRNNSPKIREGMKTEILTNRTPLDELILKEYENIRRENMNIQGNNKDIIKKFVIPCSEAKRGRQILDEMGYDTGRVFPGYKGIAQHILEKHKYES